MPSLAGIQAAYERALERFDRITVTQGATFGTARGRIYNETSVGLTDSIEQGRLKAILLASDLPFVPSRGDLLDAGSMQYVIQSVDDATRRVGAVTIAYEVSL
jgi:hypothetical protein